MSRLPLTPVCSATQRTFRRTDGRTRRNITLQHRPTVVLTTASAISADIYRVTSERKLLSSPNIIQSRQRQSRRLALPNLTMKSSCILPATMLPSITGSEVLSRLPGIPWRRAR